MNAALDQASRVLGIEPGISPFAVRRRYRELVKEWHPDRYPHGSPAQAEATRRTQEINAAYRTITDAARRGEIPLRRPRPSAPTETLPILDLSKDTVLERVVAGAAWAFLGLLLDRFIPLDWGVVQVAVPVVLGIAGAAFGWRSLERLLWWVLLVW
jgi:preprotein translocase subunit Sec63